MGCGSSSHPIVTAKNGNNYVKGKQLGVGASCSVNSVTCKETGKKYAMKELRMDVSSSKEMWDIEVCLLKILGDHPHQNVLHFEDAFQDEKNYYILTALCEGGELFDRVANGTFSERKAAYYTKMMLESVAHCHTLHLCHRDLKPENFVFDDSREDANMRLIDFGVAKVLQDDEKNADALGSPYYVAPEVLDDVFQRTGKSWKASDMWSIGVIIFLFVVGYPPFNSTGNGDETEEIYNAISTTTHTWPKWAKKKLSPEVMDLVNKLLNKDPFARPTALEALKHPWVGSNTVSNAPVDKAVVEALNGFRSACRLKKAVAKVVGNRMTPDDIAHVEILFKQFDKNGDGRLGPEEISAMMAHIGQGSKAARAMLEMADADGDGGLNFEEFKTVQATAQVDAQTDAQKKATFDMFDKDGDGGITGAELAQMLKMKPEEADAMIKEVDSSGDGKVDFKEWMAAMQSKAGKK